MPGWHKKTLQLQKEGKLQIVGLIQEQHPDRCQLFMQWKQLDWPVLVDSLNLLGLSAVPINMLVDEHGILRSKRASAKDLEAFIDTNYEAPSVNTKPPVKLSLAESKKRAVRGSRNAEAWLQYGDLLFLNSHEKPERLTTAITAYNIVNQIKDTPEAWFRKGVAFRRRFESPSRQKDDFQNAVRCWGKALSLRPNQYIWRRRIQQYGPRLQKPYAFYDWIREARKDIEKRGEKPHVLRVEPRGAELAHPSKKFDTKEPEQKSPDPEGKIKLDSKLLIQTEITVAPHKIEPGKSVRVHLNFKPNAKQKAHWNNEAGLMELWVEPTSELKVSRKLTQFTGPQKAISDENRKLEFEVQLSNDARAIRRWELKAYILYYVCEDVNGICQYLRQNITIPLN